VCPPEVPAWINREDCFGISGRVDAAGSLIEPVCNADIKQLAKAAKGYASVAICTLFSFLNPEQEQAASDILPADLFVSRSYEVLAEYREFERAAATFLNAYVGPLVKQYLLRLSDTLASGNSGKLFVMHSAGGVMDVREAGKNAVRMVLSEATIADLPVAVPMLDIHTIGAGGGSIAWRDAAGLLQAGPESAGADPGPACYGLGGAHPTVTDAHVILGHIPRNAKLAGNIPIDAGKAELAIARLGNEFGMNILEMARGIIRVAEEKMAGALRVVSVQRGYAPNNFALLCFGGAGGLHACALAESLDIPDVILPVASGAFSALGMLSGQRQYDVSQTHRIQLTKKNAPTVERIFSRLKTQVKRRAPTLHLSIKRAVDMRYRGQGFHLTIPYTSNIDNLASRFIHTHAKAYGHTLDQPLEIMTLRLSAIAETKRVCLPELPQAASPVKPSGHSGTEAGRTPHYRREILRPGHTIEGPALILEDTATLWLPPCWHLEVSLHGHLILKMGDSLLSSPAKPRHGKK